MVTFKRFAQALRDYYQEGKVGDIAFLKTKLFEAGTNPELAEQLQVLSGYYPTIDLEQSAQLPQGTLGYEYAQHMKKHGLQPLTLSPDLQKVAESDTFALRIMATYDLCHVLLDFDTSYPGEVGVFGFMVAQNYSKTLSAVQFLSMSIAPLLMPHKARAMFVSFRRGKALGRRAKCLLTYRFERDWARPVEEIRAELGLV